MFTDLAINPVVSEPLHRVGSKSEHNLFGGFSFVGSRSLLKEAGNDFP